MRGQVCLDTEKTGRFRPRTPHGSLSWPRPQRPEIIEAGRPTRQSYFFITLLGEGRECQRPTIARKLYANGALARSRFDLARCASAESRHDGLRSGRLLGGGGPSKGGHEHQNHHRFFIVLVSRFSGANRALDPDPRIVRAAVSGLSDFCGDTSRGTPAKEKYDRGAIEMPEQQLGLNIDPCSSTGGRSRPTCITRRRMRFALDRAESNF